MTHFSQTSNGDYHSASDTGCSSHQPNQPTSGTPAALCRTLELPQDDIVRPELRNDAILAVKPPLPPRQPAAMRTGRPNRHGQFADSND